MKKIFSFIAIAIFFALPLTTNAVLAGNILDPLCLFSWRDGCKDNTTYNTNINSNVNSPGGIIIGNTSVIDTNPYSYGSTNIYSGGYYEQGGNYYEGYSEYHYNDDYNGNNNHSLNVSCYPDDRYVEEGDDVRWTASVSGGNGSYNYDWSGSEGLHGNSRTVTIEYDHEGTKSASVRVSSGSRSVTESCGNVYVENDNDHDYDDDDYDNDSFSISCDADSSTAYVGERVRWEVDVRGASIRDIEWSGTEGLDGDDEDVSITYDYSGYKSAHVEVRTNEGTKSRSCGSVYVYEKQYSYNPTPIYTNVNSNNGALTLICTAYPQKTTVNSVVTWIATASGGRGGYSYSWTGTDGIKGGQASLVTSYTTPGTKSSVITVRSASGEVITRACEQSVTINPKTVSSVKKPVAVAPTPTPEKEEEKHTAASIFSLGNVPWGGVALITIFVLFSTVMYLVFTKKD